MYAFARHEERSPVHATCNTIETGACWPRSILRLVCRTCVRSAPYFRWEMGPGGAVQDNKVRENSGDAWQPIAIMQGTRRYAHNWRR